MDQRVESWKNLEENAWMMSMLPICERKANLGNKSNMRGLLDLGFYPTLNLRAQPEQSLKSVCHL